MAVALYARVSTVRQAEQDLSIPDQLRQMQDWCTRNGLLVAKEYVEAGASATDDRRPVFQTMIGDATTSPSPFDAIIVHSLSRFFRDSLEFGLYERKLNKGGVKVISITQQTSDDSAGNMSKKIFSLFDEYQSKENGKHTLRAMKENARQGYFNGSKPPFGYRTVDCEVLGNKGKKKKKLAIDDGQAAVVKKIYHLYLEGMDGLPMGMKAIADHLNRRGSTLHGKPWRLQKIQQILSDTVYMGDYHFNRTSDKGQQKKPAAEWIRTEVPAIIDRVTFEEVRELRSNRAPSQTSPRIVTSPTLLTGLLKCGCCGSGLTLATGKSGRYKYYRCTTRSSKATFLCTTAPIPMEKLDELVLRQLADKVFTKARVTLMVKELKKRLKNAHTLEDEQLRALKLSLKSAEEGIERLYQAVEQGILPLDDTLTERGQKLKSHRQAIMLEMASLRGRQEIPVNAITPKRVDEFAKALRAKLLDRSSSFGKQYLRLLVDQIVISGKCAEITGSYANLARVLVEPTSKRRLGTITVPSFIPKWRPVGDSNPCTRRERAIS